MKNLIIILCALQYVACRNVKTDLITNYFQDLEKLRIFTQNLKESGKYSSSDPITINQDDITLKVYTRADTNGNEIPLTDSGNITKVSSFNADLKTVFFVHGWRNTINDDSCMSIKRALLDVADVNVIIVNWDKCANTIDYFASQRCGPEIGKYVGQFIENMAQIYSYSLSDIMVVGHSMGAHICGHIGKYTNGSLGIIVGLDPAGPFYFEDIRSARLTEDDAQYVQAIHTNALLMGVNYKIGHGDYWPDGGFTQNGCELWSECSHNIAYEYFAESVSNNAFFSRQCDSYDHFEENECHQNSKSLMGGFNVNTSGGYRRLKKV